MMMSGSTVEIMPAVGRRPLPARLLRCAARIAGRRLTPTVTHVHTKEPLAALTFDDGPDPNSTPQLLDILARHGAKATFFMLGVNARSHPDLVDRIAREGHALANHSYDHPRLPELPRAERRRQILACQAALGPFGHKLFRPPRGLQSLASYIDVRSLGYTIVTWNVHALDWEVHTADWYAHRLADEVRPGSIVLLHDKLQEVDFPGAEDRAPMLAGLDRFLEWSRSKLRFVTVPELLASGRVNGANWFVPSDEAWARHNP